MNQGPVIQPTDLPRLRWRCRRGMKELDALLLPYLEQQLLSDSPARQHLFLQLLDTEDDRLWKWVVGLEAPEDVSMRDLLEVITARTRV